MTDAAALVEFLLARYAEDEAAARAAGGEWWYEAEVPGVSLRRSPDEPTHWIVDSPAVLVSYRVSSQEKAVHIAQWSPERVLAECEAKRRIVSEHGSGSDPCDHAYDTSLMGWMCLTLRLLALPYADHPDFRPEWRP